MNDQYELLESLRDKRLLADEHYGMNLSPILAHKLARNFA